MSKTKIVQIDTHYNRSEFKRIVANVCCVEHQELVDYIKQCAYKHSKDDFYKTYALINKQNSLMAYISFSLATINKADLVQMKPTASTYPPYPVPALKITRLLVSDDFKKQGLGTQLLKLADILAFITAHQVGCKLILVDAKKDARDFYESKGNFISKLDNEQDNTTILMYKMVEKDQNTDIQRYINYCKDYSLQSLEIYLHAINAEKSTP